jgi:hypothetical protein
MPELIQGINNPELVFGLVAPIGANVERCVTALSNLISSYGYTPVVVKVTDCFQRLQPHLKFHIPLRDHPLGDRYNSYIKYGDAFRKLFDDDSFLAAVAISAIIHKRKSTSPEHRLLKPEKIAYIIRSSSERKRSNCFVLFMEDTSFRFLHTQREAHELTI